MRVCTQERGYRLEMTLSFVLCYWSFRRLLIRKWNVGRRKVCCHFVENGKTAVVHAYGVSMASGSGHRKYTT